VYISTYISSYIPTYIYAYVYIYTWIRTRTYTFTYTYTHEYTYTHTPTYSYTYTYILTYIHTYVCMIYIHIIVYMYIWYDKIRKKRVYISFPLSILRALFQFPSPFFVKLCSCSKSRGENPGWHESPVREFLSLSLSLIFSHINDYIDVNKYICIFTVSVSMSISISISISTSTVPLYPISIHFFAFWWFKNIYIHTYIYISPETGSESVRQVVYCFGNRV